MYTFKLKFVQDVVYVYFSVKYMSFWITGSIHEIQWYSHKKMLKNIKHLIFLKSQEKPVLT